MSGSSRRTLCGVGAAAVPLDHNLEVLRGNVTGHAMVSIFGHMDTLSSTRVTIAPGLIVTDVDQSGLITTAATVDVASTDANDDVAGTGLLTLRLQGLDSSGAAQTETITLTGTTEVTSANTYSAVTGWRGLTAGSGAKNAGLIYVGNGTFTAGVPTTIYFTGEAGHNKGLSGYYAVPTGKTLYLRALTLTMVGTSKESEVSIETSTDGVFWVTEAQFGVESGVDFQGRIIAVPGIAADTHIRLTGAAGGASTELSAILGCELVDD